MFLSKAMFIYTYVSLSFLLIRNTKDKKFIYELPYHFKLTKQNW
jgi:hypothetical protein